MAQWETVRVCLLRLGAGLVTAQRDPAIRRAINWAGLATEDGMPLVWWSHRTGFAAAARVCGSDLLAAMCARGAATGHRHYFT
jgi:N-acetylglucosaminyldiphosphoundecaprenol N-acetyl-beta-D-mannosaminyltransferase